MTTTACDSLLGLVLDTRGNPLLLPPSALLCSFWRLHSVVGKKAHVDRHDESNVGRDKSFTPAFRSNQPGQVIVANREEGRAHVPARDLELPEEAACAGEFLKVHRFPPTLSFFGLDLKQRSCVPPDIKFPGFIARRFKHLCDSLGQSCLGQ